MLKYKLKKFNRRKTILRRNAELRFHKFKLAHVRIHAGPDPHHVQIPASLVRVNGCPVAAANNHRTDLFHVVPPAAPLAVLRQYYTAAPV